MNNRLFSRKDLVCLIIPLIVDQFLQVAVGLSDSIMVARVGEAAVSGVSLVDTVMLLIINIFTALATGGAVIAGQYLGRKDPKTGCEATAQLFNFTFLFSIFIMILGYLGQNVILYHVFGKIEPEVMKDSRTYLLIVLASIPMIAMYNAGAAIFRAMGNSNIAMKTSLLMNSINVFGNALLIFGFHCGVEGVAIPTVVSRGVACVVILVLLNNQEHALHILHHWDPERSGKQYVPARKDRRAESCLRSRNCITRGKRSQQQYRKLRDPAGNVLRIRTPHGLRPVRRRRRF